MSKDGFDLFRALVGSAEAMIRLSKVIQSEDFVESMGLHPLDGYSEFVRRCLNLSQMQHYCRMCLSLVSNAPLDFNLTQSMIGDLHLRVDSLKN